MFTIFENKLSYKSLFSTYEWNFSDKNDYLKEKEKNYVNYVSCNKYNLMIIKIIIRNVGSMH